MTGETSNHLWVSGGGVDDSPVSEDMTQPAGCGGKKESIAVREKIDMVLA
jgi:hypothetical protein